MQLSCVQMSHRMHGEAVEIEMDGALARAVAERMQVLASPSRVWILSRLKDGPCSVGELADAVSMEACAVSVSLLVLLVTAAAQAVVFVATGSVALLADLIHNFGDALTAVPLGIAFVLRSFVAEKRAGYFVVATIFTSACVALIESINR